MLALPGLNNLLSTLSVADNLTQTASYHGMPWAELDAALALLPALALDAAAWRALLATTEQLSADDRRRVLLLRQRSPRRRLADRQRFFAGHPDLASRARRYQSPAGPAGGISSPPGRPRKPGAEWKEPRP